MAVAAVLRPCSWLSLGFIHCLQRLVAGILYAQSSAQLCRSDVGAGKEYATEIEEKKLQGAVCLPQVRPALPCQSPRRVLSPYCKQESHLQLVLMPIVLKAEKSSCPKTVLLQMAALGLLRSCSLQASRQHTRPFNLRLQQLPPNSPAVG